MKVAIILISIALGVFAEPPPSQYLPPSNQYGAPNGQSNTYLPPSNGGYPASNGGYPSNGGEDESSEPASYSFKYDVQDAESGNDFGHEETREGDVATGKYYVLLPDGRRQTVEYVADSEGYKPKITYEQEGNGNGNGNGNGYQNGGYPTNGRNGY